MTSPENDFNRHQEDAEIVRCEGIAVRRSCEEASVDGPQLLHRRIATTMQKDWAHMSFLLAFLCVPPWNFSEKSWKKDRCPLHIIGKWDQRSNHPFKKKKPAGRYLSLHSLILHEKGCFHCFYNHYALKATTAWIFRFEIPGHEWRRTHNQWWNCAKHARNPRNREVVLREFGWAEKMC